MCQSFVHRSIIYLMLSAMLVSCSDNDPLPFDSAQWKQGDRYLRGRMTTHLMKDSLLIGKSRSEIVEILGSSEDDSEVKSLNYIVHHGNTGPMDLGGPWVFDFKVILDSTTQKVIAVTCRD